MEEPTRTLQDHEAREPKPANLEGAKLAAANADAQDNNKRKHGNGGFSNSEYFKIRAIVKDLRPFFMEILHTPDFRESKAAYEIQKGMNTMMELTKHLTKTESALKTNKAPEQQLDGVVTESAGKKVELEKQSKHPEPSEIRAQSGSRVVEGQKEESKSGMESGTEGLSRGSFVVGGSPVGWNFLLYPGRKLFYYGRTKESVLAARASK